MTSNLIEIADQRSRRRALGAAIAVVVFVAIQLISRPFFRSDWVATPGTSIDIWALNAGILLLLLATGGGLIWSRALRGLIDDDVSQLHYRRGLGAGFWSAMVTAMTIYLVPALRTMSGPAAVYLIVTISTVAALSSFAFLELRAHHGE